MKPLSSESKQKMGFSDLFMSRFCVLCSLVIPPHAVWQRKVDSSCDWVMDTELIPGIPEQAGLTVHSLLALHCETIWFVDLSHGAFTCTCLSSARRRFLLGNLHSTGKRNHQLTNRHHHHPTKNKLLQNRFFFFNYIIPLPGRDP